ncbi:unnamed protein product [Adineta ricciae]|uniref:Uncharacterized protein n=1 Tax=Adineta ricciae TaxID=249248 RepID=A0A814BBW0_ADIRI|nr:unnamed protein product [Adineta ricciae]
MDSNLTENSTISYYNQESFMSYETMRIFFFAIAIITVLICLTICTTVCICICLKRRRELTRHENRAKLLPEQPVKSSSKRSTQKASNNSTTANGKQSSIVLSSSSNATNSAVKSFYDNLDDIPFIDESRPTSVIDITQV